MPFLRWPRHKKKNSLAEYYHIPELEPWVEAVVEEFEMLEQGVQARLPAFVAILEDWKSRTYRWADQVKSIRWPRVKWPKWARPQAFTFPRVHFAAWGATVIQALRGFVRQTVRVAAASLALFVVGFLVMNAPAYSDLLKTSIAEWSGAPVDHSLEEHFVEESAVEQELLAFTNNPDEQREQMASLDLDVTPPDNRLIIPRLNKNIPIVESDPNKLMGADWKSLEKTFQEDLQNGVLHYPGTAKPGEVGNAFITGHSSYYLWDSGRYKNVFARLSQVEVGDDLIVYYDQQKYHYRIIEKKEVKNDDVSVLAQTDRSLLTLMTCSPVGTNIRRLVVLAELVE